MPLLLFIRMSLITICMIGLISGCSCLPIEYTVKQESLRTKDAITLSSDGNIVFSSPLPKPLAIEAKGKVLCLVAFELPDDYLLQGNAIVVRVNGEVRGQMQYFTGESGRKDNMFDLTEFLTKGKNTVSFHSVVMKCPGGGNGPSTKTARVITDSLGTLIEHECYQLDQCGIEAINDEWVINWSPS